MKQDVKTPPHSAEAERGVLGSILLDATGPEEDSRVLDLCLTSGINEESFFDLRNRKIFAALTNLAREAQPLDAITLNERLRADGNLDAVGGIAYVADLVDSTPTSAHAEYYIEIIRQKHLLRKIINTARDIETKCYDDNAGNADVVLGEFETKALNIGGKGAQGKSWKNAVTDMLRSLDRAFDQGANVFEGLSTGFKDLDLMLQGMKPSEMIVIAARPSVGKTSLAMNIAECVAMGETINGIPTPTDNGKKHPVLVFSLEMDTDSLAKRMLSGRAHINTWALKHNTMHKSEKQVCAENLFKAAAELKNAEIYIDETGGLDIMDLRARARRMKKRHGIELIVIDYLQLCTSREFAKQGRQIEVSHISAQVKAMAKELKIPVIVLSQLSRANEKRGDKIEKPKLSDLRDSGSIEQDADVVMLLRRPCRTPTDPEHNKLNLAIVDVAKHRNGEIGDVRMNFNGDWTRFGDRDYREDKEGAEPVFDDSVPIEQ